MLSGFLSGLMQIREDCSEGCTTAHMLTLKRVNFMVCKFHFKKSKHDAGGGEPSCATHSAIINVPDQRVVHLKFTQYVYCIAIKLREGAINYCGWKAISRSQFSYPPASRLSAILQIPLSAGRSNEALQQQSVSVESQPQHSEQGAEGLVGSRKTIKYPREVSVPQRKEASGSRKRAGGDARPSKQ